MSQTTAQIRNQAAQKMGLLGTGQTLQSAISADIDQAYLEVYAMLESKGLANWGTSSTAVPNELVEPIVAMVAGIRSTRYAIPTERYQRIKIEESGAEDRIRTVLAQRKFAPTRINNY